MHSTPPEAPATGAPDAPAPDLEAGAAGEPAAPAGPAPRSDASYSQEFARNLAGLREQRGLTLNQLAAQSDIDLDSVKKYESGQYRPKAPKLLQLARALDVMPISLGPGAVRGTEPPVAPDVLLRKRGSRALRVQQLAELLAGQRVSVLAQLSGVSVEDLYALASSETQLTDAALEPLLRGLPTVRTSWLLSAEGEPLTAPATAPSPAIAAPPPPAAAPPIPSDTPEDPAPRLPGPVPTAGSLGTGALSRGNCYLPLATGQLVEVVTIPTPGGPALTQLRLLAGAGQLPGVTGGEPLDALCQVLRELLTAVEAA